MTEWPWHPDPPEQDGDFFYSGPPPDGSHINIVAIAQVYTPSKGERSACVFMPLGPDRQGPPKVYFGTLDLWPGEWAGPEYGLCTVVNG